MEPGTILAGKYRLESLLGRGGMGSVWRAQHLALHAPIAVKVISGEIRETPAALARFKREAKAAAALRSPHVVQIIDHGVDPGTGTPFIAMEMLEGQSLADRLERRGRISPRETAQVVVQVARALTRAHAASIVHRDLKPDNIFLVQNEDEEIAKVLDFGIAKDRTLPVAEAVTSTGMVIGTAFYMSPEQISGSRLVDHRTDLWALGVIACECLTGEKPFKAETLGGLVLEICSHPLPVPSSRRPVPVGFDGWFARAVARDPERRFQSAREMAHALEALVTSSQVQLPSAEVPPARVMPPSSGVAELGAPTFSAAYHPATPLPSGPARMHTGVPVSSNPDSGGLVPPSPGVGRWWFAAIALLALAGAALWMAWSAPPEPDEPEAPSIAESGLPDALATHGPTAVASEPVASEPPLLVAPGTAPGAAPSSPSVSPSPAGPASDSRDSDSTPTRRRRVAETPAAPRDDGPIPVKPSPADPAPAPQPGRDLLDTRK